MPLSPEERAQFEAMGAIQTALLKGLSERLVTIALAGMEHGCGASLVVAARSQEFPELASYVVVCTGKYTDDDIARIKEYTLAAAQDATTGFQSRKEEDSFGKPEGSC